MSNFSVRFPDSLYLAAKNLAKKNGTSLNQFILTAIAKEIGWQEASTFYQHMMDQAATQKKYHRILDQAPDIEPEIVDDRI